MQNAPLVTVKNVLRVLTTIALIMFFCPMFLVSCSGHAVDVTGANMMTGIKYRGERMSDPHILAIILLLIPVAMVALLFVKKFADNMTAKIIAGGAAVDTIAWFISKSLVKRYAEENYCTFKTSGWFIFNIIILALILCISALIALGRLNMNAELINAVSSRRLQDTLNQLQTATSKLASNVEQQESHTSASGYCQKCGAALEIDSEFCTSCGAPVEKDETPVQMVTKSTPKPVHKQAACPKCQTPMEKTEDGEHYYCKMCNVRYKIVKKVAQ